MSAQTETSQSGMLDTLKLLMAAAALVGGLYAYYYYEPSVAQAFRVLMVLGGTIAGIGIAMTSIQGQRLWHFIQGSRGRYRYCDDEYSGPKALALYSGLTRLTR